MCICCIQTKEKSLVAKNSYKIVQCLNCGLIYVKDSLGIDKLKKFYTADYFFRNVNGGSLPLLRPPLAVKVAPEAFQVIYVIALFICVLAFIYTLPNDEPNL